MGLGATGGVTGSGGGGGGLPGVQLGSTASEAAEGDVMLDVLASISFNLQFDVFRDTNAFDLDGDVDESGLNAFGALQAWLRLLADYLPGATLRAAFGRLSAALTLEAQGGSSGEGQMARERWNQMLDAALFDQSLLPRHPQWRVCVGSTWEHHRGYPCGLWLLFHTLSMRHESQGAAAAQQSAQFVPVLRGFVSHFFGTE